MKRDASQITSSSLVNLWQRIISWIDSSALITLSLFLLIFIPLFPKLPLFDAIPGYLVRVRFEDFLVGLTGIIWLVQLLRGKLEIPKVFLLGVVAFVLIGILSTVSSIFLVQTIPPQLLHIGKSGLHFFRYLEYFSLFFFMFSAIRTRRQIKIALSLLALTVILATIYGFGQKYWSWPLYSTMNREYSKGVQLFLGANARVQSTFAGHYDLAAFLVIVTPILLAAVLFFKQWWVKIGLLIVIAAGSWLLVASGSKMSFIAYGVALYATVLLFLRQYQRIFRGLLIANILILISSFGIFGYFLTHPLDTRLFDALQSLKTTAVVAQITPLAQLLEKTQAVLKSQTTSVSDKPTDVFVDVPDYVQVAKETESGKIIQVTEERERTWSQNALKYGLSMGIRLDTLWPQAVKGVQRNLMLGSGFGTLNKTSSGHFIEADSTDNNFLRTLGEIGIIGFVLFYSLIFMLLKISNQGSRVKEPIIASICLGFMGATIGLLTNALIIDVFVASKVAFTFWAVAGLMLKTITLAQPQAIKRLEKTIFSFLRHTTSRHWPVLLATVVLIFLIHRNPVLPNSVIANFEAQPAATEALTTVKCWLSQHQWQLCRGELAQPTRTSVVYGAYLLPFYSAFPQISIFYYANLALAILSLALLYQLTKQLKIPQWHTSLLLIFYSLLAFILPVVYSPVDANVSLVLLLCGVWSVTKLRESQNLKWWVAVIGLGLGSFSTGYQADLAGLIYIFTPVILIGLGLWLKTLKMRIAWENAATRLTLALGIGSFMSLIWLVTPLPQHFSVLWQEYQIAFNADRVTAMAVFNNFFTNLPPSVKKDPKPYLVTSLNPYFMDFYSNFSYAPLPLTLTQPFGKHPNQVWGEHNFQSPTAIVKQVFAQSNSVFLTNANLETTSQNNAFSELKTAFDVDLMTLGCEENCNIYQLQASPSATPKLVTVNQKPLTLSAQEYSFAVVSHRFNITIPKRGHDVFGLINQLKTILPSRPDFMIISGDIVNNSQPFYQTAFLKQFANLAPFPIIFSAGNYDEIAQKPFDAGYQSFSTPHDLFILLSANENGMIPSPDVLALYNTLLDLEKQPHIKNIFLITHRLNWITNSEGYESLAQITNQAPSEADIFYRQRILPKLQAFSDKKIYVISGDLRFAEQPTIFYDQNQRDGVTYIASAVNHDPQDVYLRFSVNAQGEVVITPLSLWGKTLEPIEKYGVTYWQSVLPNLSTPTMPEKDNQLKSLLQKTTTVLVSGLTLGLGAEILYRALQTIRKRHLRLPF